MHLINENMAVGNAEDAARPVRFMTAILNVAAESRIDPPPGRAYAWIPFTFPFNLTQQPAASIPCGLTAAGLPVGLHLVGPKYADARVLRAARAFETVRPIKTPNL